MARRAVILTKLAELYNVSLSEESTTNLAISISKIPDWELDKINDGVPPIVGCPANIIPTFAGYSQHCPDCPYNLGGYNNKKQSNCALKEEKTKIRR